MNVTFLVEINLDDLTSLVEVAGDIEDDLAGKYDVRSVKPWARPSQQLPVDAFQSLVQPQQPQQQPIEPIP